MCECVSDLWGRVFKTKFFWTSCVNSPQSEVKGTVKIALSECCVCSPDAAEEVRHDEREDDGLLEQRLGRLQTGDVLPAHARVVADDLAGDLR